MANEVRQPKMLYFSYLVFVQTVETSNYTNIYQINHLIGEGQNEYYSEME